MKISFQIETKNKSYFIAFGGKSKINIVADTGKAIIHKVWGKPKDTLRYAR